MVMEPNHLNSVDEDIAQRRAKEKKEDVDYHRKPFLRHIVNTLVVLGILAVVVLIFVIVIANSR
ncbi:hypothetical protein [Paenibacillus physcomitrellae]|uniref:Amino acid transporter n=1 Tax=Paenibacillus physcomitrellae TaxID=1619311 RepID=A0ABQ1FY86_9BACL|nr:hypothetical protein [Paenibacillus physcomitrellae]GGA33769.1 hypothetical protein GCM10010917_18740 [Paenibacillus physcomitrellae]